LKSDDEFRKIKTHQKEFDQTIKCPARNWFQFHRIITHLIPTRDRRYAKHLPFTDSSLKSIKRSFPKYNWHAERLKAAKKWMLEGSELQFAIFQSEI
jgi:hypothetical protein